MSFFDKFKKKQAATGVLNTGSPEGNPGYSLSAPTYATQHYDAKTRQVTGGELLTPAGATWVGAPGGDTPEARAQFEKWLRTSTIFGGQGVAGQVNYLVSKNKKK